MRERIKSMKSFTQSGFLLQSFGKDKANYSALKKDSRVKTVVDIMSADD